MKNFFSIPEKSALYLFTLLFIIIIIGSNNLKAQNIAITDEDGYTPHPNAMLDVYSLNKGMLVPRMELIDSDTPISDTKEIGLLVWNTSTEGEYPETGFYFWNGTNWEKVGTTTYYENGLTQDGEYVGLGGYLTRSTSIDLNDYNLNFDLTGNGVFDIGNGSSIFHVNEGGYVGIGTNSPNYLLDVNGSSNFNGNLYLNGLLKLGTNISIEGSGTYKVYRNLASFGNSSDEGAFVIHTNHPMSVASMFRVKIEGFTYSNPEGPFEITLGAYKSGSSFGHSGYLSVGPHNYLVRLARNASGNMAIIIGETTTNSTHPKLTVTEYMQGYSGFVESYAEGWTIERLTDLSAFSIITEVPNITTIDVDLSNYYTIGEVDGMHDGMIDDIAAEDLWDRSESYTYLKNSSDFVGIGTPTPLANLHIKSSTSVGKVIIAPYGSNYDSELFFAESSASTLGMTWTYDGGDNKLYAFGKYNATVWGPHLSIARDNGRVVVGVETDLTPATSRLVVEGNTTGAIDDPIFEVKNNDGETVFAVYNEGVRIWVNDGPTKATGNRGGFAVGGFSSGKGETNEYLRVTPDSVRMYFDVDEAKATGNRGGFAVGGFSSGKDIPVDLMHLRKDNYFIGHSAGINTISTTTTGINNIFMGYESGISNSTGSRNIFLGYRSGYLSNVGGYNIFVGFNSGYYNRDGNYNTYIGYESGKFSGYTNGANYNNTFLGYKSGYYNLAGYNNTFIGYKAGAYNLSGHNNVFIGDSTGYRNQEGLYNVFIGSGAGTSNLTANYNVFIGYNAGVETEHGGYNTTVGYKAGAANVDGVYQVLFGYSAGAHNTGDHNTFIGSESGYFSGSGVYNTYIGMGAGREATGSNNIFIGKYAGYSAGSTSDKLYIDNTNTNTPLIWGDFVANSLRFNGVVGIGRAPSSLYGLYVDGGSSYEMRIVGTAHASVAFVSDSDERWKKNIVTYPTGLETVLKLRGVNFEYRVDEFPENGFETGVHIGFIAQELEKVVPALVHSDEKGFRGVDYSKVTPLLVEAIKEQQKLIIKLQNQITEKDNEIASIKEQLEKLDKLEVMVNKLNEILELKTQK